MWLARWSWRSRLRVRQQRREREHLGHFEAAERLSRLAAELDQSGERLRRHRRERERQPVAAVRLPELIAVPVTPRAVKMETAGATRRPFLFLPLA